ncbi:hypothetical protein NSQ77_20050 [Oceanobacillus sp. FSL K6-2867]|uniref:hypothetical protein n=1 Tax=Oceanobacillus sp. FSL K6-2867 TaxID=2954748 RepID=UPI0030DDB78D
MIFTYVFIGVTGAVLITLGALDSKVNQSAIKVTLELLKFGAAFYLLYLLSKSFL